MAFENSGSIAANSFILLDPSGNIVADLNYTSGNNNPALTLHHLDPALTVDSRLQWSTGAARAPQSTQLTGPSSVNNNHLRSFLNLRTNNVTTVSDAQILSRSDSASPLSQVSTSLDLTNNIATSAVTATNTPAVATVSATGNSAGTATVANAAQTTLSSASLNVVATNIAGGGFIIATSDFLGLNPGTATTLNGRTASFIVSEGYLQANAVTNPIPTAVTPIPGATVTLALNAGDVVHIQAVFDFIMGGLGTTLNGFIYVNGGQAGGGQAAEYTTPTGMRSTVAVNARIPIVAAGNYTIDLRQSANISSAGNTNGGSHFLYQVFATK